MRAFDQHARQLAHDVVDKLFDHIQTAADGPVVDWTSPDALRELVAIDLRSGDYLELVDLICSKSIQLHHPSYMGHQVCPPLPQAVIADLVISALNQSTAVWEMSPIATVIEKEVVRWLSRCAGYPDTSLGTAVSGGSAANLTALLCARARQRGAIICSADAHYSVARAATIMGMAPAEVIEVETDSQHRMDVAALRKALERNRGRVMAIVATAGSTATGSFDDLESIAGLRDEYDTWLHVDAAHGASVLLSDRLRPLVRGLERADSFAWDPHKMMWMPLSLGVVLVRDARWLRAAFRADAPYLFDQRRAGANIGEVTIQCSKRADAVKLWLTLKTGGAAAIGAALERVTEVTRHLYTTVRESPDFEALHQPQFNIFCFRYRGDDQLNQELRDRVIEGGKAWITTTLLKERRALRVTIINPRTSEADVEAMLDLVRSCAR